MEIDEAAQEAVEGILREDITLSIPSHLKPLSKFINIMPHRMQELARDRVMREHEFIDADCRWLFQPISADK